MAGDPLQEGALADWGVAGCAYPGEEVSGDLHCVIETPDGVLAAVVDGLGHGPEAGAAARTAVQVLSDGQNRSVTRMFQDCHTALRGTRGVVMSAAWISAADQSLTWLGVGNVDGYLLRGPAWTDSPSGVQDAEDMKIQERESLLMRGGVVGYRIPTLRAASLPAHAGDTLIFATDGLALDPNRFMEDNCSPQAIADHILAEFRRGTDDALVLVVRYKGGACR